jgi:hypothetical protein
MCSTSDSHLVTQQLRMTMLSNRPQIVDTYINKYIDSLTLTEKEELLYQFLESDFERISDAQLIREVSEFFPELL